MLKKMPKSPKSMGFEPTQCLSSRWVGNYNFPSLTMKKDMSGAGFEPASPDSFTEDFSSGKSTQRGGRTCPLLWKILPF